MRPRASLRVSMKKDKSTEIIEQEIERKSPETIVILGAPGSGKDTQANFLVEALGYQTISTGELVRILAGHDDNVREMMEKGDLVPDSIVEDELISSFILLPEGQPVILDGYPRNVQQAKRLEEILEENNRKLDRVIFINVSDKDLTERVGKRRICKRCSNIQVGGEKCEGCGAELTIRSDDKPEAVKERLKVFHEATEPVINYFKENGVLVEVDGTPAPDKVKEEIRKLL